MLAHWSDRRPAPNVSREAKDFLGKSKSNAAGGHSCDSCSIGLDTSWAHRAWYNLEPKPLWNHRPPHATDNLTPPIWALEMLGLFNNTGIETLAGTGHAMIWPGRLILHIRVGEAQEARLLAFRYYRPRIRSGKVPTQGI